MLSYSIADIQDNEPIIALLQSNDLPVSDIKESKIDFIVVKEESAIVGCIGLEKYGAEGLLRSFAVKADYRNRGLGKELYSRLIDHARQNGVETLHLLTDTAKEYFEKVGFNLSNRSSVPELIAQSKEFSSLCPASSSYMVLQGINHAI